MIKSIVQKITSEGCRLSIVRNPDLFLTIDDVRQALYKEYGLKVVTGSRLDLRIHFETIFKDNPEEKFVYICDEITSLVPDMSEEALVTKFAIGDVFSFFTDKSLLASLDLQTLQALYKRIGFRRIGLFECQRIIKEVKEELEEINRQSTERLQKQISNLSADWETDSDNIIRSLSTYMVEAIRFGRYDLIEQKIGTLNDNFQKWIDRNYFSILNSNHLNHPKSVNKILPYLADNHLSSDKIALIVIDGLSYWQYNILSQLLVSKGIKPNEGYTLAWIPTITMLSRQAIFRGDIPKADYKQNPSNEERLWRIFWLKRGLSEFAIQYVSDKDDFSINPNATRIAYVTVEMDEKMHSSSDYKDLLSLTENWAPRMAEKIMSLKELGYKIYLTSDHGSVISNGWQSLNQSDKVYLYKDGSRGKRHLIYYSDNIDQKNDFHSKHINEIDMLTHDNWIVARGNDCFDREGQKSITHGGSHLLEVVIPFITIE